MGNASEKRLLTHEELELRAVELARPAEAVEEDHLDQEGVLTIELCEEWYGVPVRHVREVISRPIVTPVPSAPSFVAGLMNLRGDIIGVLDLAVLLGIAEPVMRNGELSGFAVLVRSTESDAISAAILADRVNEVTWRAPGVFERVPPTIPAARAAYFKETFRLQDRLVTTLHIDRVLSHPDLAGSQET